MESEPPPALAAASTRSVKPPRSTAPSRWRRGAPSSAARERGAAAMSQPIAQSRPALAMQPRIAAVGIGPALSFVLLFALAFVLPLLFRRHWRRSMNRVRIAGALVPPGILQRGQQHHRDRGAAHEKARLLELHHRDETPVSERKVLPQSQAAGCPPGLPQDAPEQRRSPLPHFAPPNSTLPSIVRDFGVALHDGN